VQAITGQSPCEVLSRNHVSCETTKGIFICDDERRSLVDDGMLVLG